MAEIKLFTREELNTRNNKSDAVLVIHNAVYDVTKFLDIHPGGEEVLLEKVGGKDSSEAFEDIGHSTDARELMKQYKIGELVEADRIELKPRTRTWADNDDSVNQNQSGVRSWLMPLVLGVLATIVYRTFFS